MVSETFQLENEHSALGASFINDEFDIRTTERYAGVSGEAYAQALASGVLVADATGALFGLIEGADSERFMSMCFAASPLEYAKACFSASFMPDGVLAGVPLIMRSGMHEYLVFDASKKATPLYTYIQTLMNIMTSPEREAPLEANFSEVDSMAVPLLVFGAKAEELLGDYLVEGETLPAYGKVSATNFDGRVPVTLCRLPLEEVAYLVVVPTQLAEVLWRSFMSFSYVIPAGFEQAKTSLLAPLSFWGEVTSLDAVRISRKDFSKAQLIREIDPALPYIGEKNI